MKDKIFDSVKDLPSIEYGTHPCYLDVDFLSKDCDEQLKSPKTKQTGSKKQNLFVKITDPVRSTIVNYLSNNVADCDWTVEYFKSFEPAGLHTDYTSVKNSWTNDDNVYCHLTLGVIIPLEWNCKQPYTINYNKTVDSPRKLMYRAGEMRYMDTDEVISYRNDWKYDNEVLQYNPAGTQYFKEYADLSVESVYKWTRGTMLVFDTRRWHSSSWFLSTDKLQDHAFEFKKSIIAFGSYNVRQ